MTTTRWRFTPRVSDERNFRALDRLLDSPPFVGARVYHSANIALADNTDVALTFDSERFDSHGFHSTSVNTTRFTVPAGKAGKYLLGGTVVFGGSAVGFRQVYLLLNSSTAIASQVVNPNTGTTLHIAITTLYELAVGDYVELIAKQTSGGSLNVLAASAFSPEFYLSRLGV